ncbi:MAG: S8 family serine peptidase [Rhodanobacteraceae bacterium]
METFRRIPGCGRSGIVALLLLSLSACGGGGGNSNVRPSSTPPPPPPPPASGTQPPFDAQLAITNTYAAHNAGYTGKGVTIGVVDSGIMRSNPTVAGRVLQELIYVDPTQNNTSIDDVVGHGTWVSEIAAGTSFGQFPGGIAPGANLVSARIISDNAPDDNGSTPPATVTVSDAQFFQQVNSDLISAGVKVMNNSWGGITWDTTSTSVNQAFDAAYSPFVQNGGLVVFAAGNDSQANPSTIAALPSVAPDLEKGWLVAVAVNSNNPSQLDSYSNKCGIAMKYCLAAPGDVIVLDKNATATTTNPSYYIVEGTSFAAPQVSGAAALVWQAYPYFSNDLVRQTLLGTADPLGGSQPNPTFGYGELDVGRAVNGPARFDWGDVTVSFSGSSNWNNPISGAGGLIMQGPGTLNLTQPSSYSGMTQVQGGTLSAVSLASDATIAAQGTLIAPSIGGNVTNSGVLQVGTSDTRIGGNYVQSGGRLSVSLGSALRVTGTATLSGGDLYVYQVNQGYVANSHTDVLTAGGGLTGTFSALDTASSVLLTATLDYDANDAWLNVQQVNVTAVPAMAYSAASLSAAVRVQGAFNQINGQLATTGATSIAPGFIAGAGALEHTGTLDVLQQSLESRSGQLHAASAALAFQAMDVRNQAMSQRFDVLGDGASGAWTQHIGGQGQLAQAGYSNIAYQMNGTMVGTDRRFGSHFVAGYALGQSGGLGWLDGGADRNRDWTSDATLYAGWLDGAWYAQGRLATGRYRQDIRRYLQLGNFMLPAGTEYRGGYLDSHAESGVHLQVGTLRITPYAELDHATLHRDAFAEAGGAGFGLESAPQDLSRSQGGLGVRAGGDWSLSGGRRLGLGAYAQWQRTWSLRGGDFEASFTGLDQWLPLAGIGLSRYGADFGGTAVLQLTPDTWLRADAQLLDAQYGRDRELFLQWGAAF